MAGEFLLLISTFVLVATTEDHSEQTSKLRFVSNSAFNCSGYTLTLECTVVGGYGTVWRGSALADCEMLLLHGDYEIPNYKKICNNGNIVGGNVHIENGVENGTYIYGSQLNVIVTLNMIGKSIECVHESENIRVIGSHMISTDHLSPPGNVHISDVNIGLRQLTFTWSLVPPDSRASHYNILASNCGSCPTTTNHTTVTCTDISNVIDTDSAVCIFAVQTVICGNISGNVSDQLSVDVTETVIHGAHPVEDTVSKSMLVAGVVSLALAGIIMTIMTTIYCRLRSKSQTWSHVSYTVRSEDRSESSTRTLEQQNKDTLDLKSLLQKLQGQVSKQWYQFGLSLGIPMDVLEEFNLYSEEDCLVEVLDYWLKNHPGKPTWQEITDAQREINTFNACQNEVSVKKAYQDDSTPIDIPPPKPPRRSSSVTVNKSMASTDATTTPKMNSKDYEHEYECID